MTKKCSIIVTAISLSVFLAIGILPHHYHEGVACLMKEHCEHACDVSAGDSHPSGGKEHTHESPSFITTAHHPAVKPHYNHKNKFSYNYLTHSYIHLLPSLYLLVDTQITLPQLLFSKWEYGEALFLYQSVDVTRSNALRAPPYLFS
ncbi:hypothetical protein [Limibacterium fermenti]|uniref:hypothetical protein n=1 Tax=Limibacterium fermenti TaxID=3229863 RepID=UPI0026BDC876